MATLSSLIQNYTSTETLDSVADRGATTNQSLTIGNLTSTGIDDNANTIAMTIDNSGQVGLGVSPSYPLDIVGTLRIRHDGTDLFSTIRGPSNRSLRIDLDANGDTDSFIVRDLRDNSERLVVEAGGDVGIGLAPTNSSAYRSMEIGQKSGSKRGRIQFNTDQGNITLYSFENGTQPYLGIYTDHASGTYIGRFDSDGLKFGSDTAAANALDDYEEGTWTPTLENGSATFTGARYVKVGRLVYAEVLVTAFTNRSTAAAVQLGGFPFNSSSNTRAGNVSLSRFINRSSGCVVSYLGSSRNYAHFYANVANGDYQQVYHSHLSSSSSNMYVSLTYEASS